MRYGADCFCEQLESIPLGKSGRCYGKYLEVTLSLFSHFSTGARKMENLSFNSHLSLTEGCSLRALISWRLWPIAHNEEIPQVKSRRGFQEQALGVSGNSSASGYECGHCTHLCCSHAEEAEFCSKCVGWMGLIELLNAAEQCVRSYWN